MGTDLQPIALERFQADTQDSDRATTQTVERMAQHIKDGARDTGVRDCARAAVSRFAGGRPGRGNAIWAIFWWAAHSLKFVQDESLFNRRICLMDGRCVTVPGTDELEMLVSPAFMVRMARPQGDCDDFTDVQLAMLRCLGIPYRIVTVKANPQTPDEWSHVYGLAVLEDGTPIPMDASHGKYPGWEIPQAHVLEYQEWDEDGRPVKAIARPVRNTLHGYRRRRGVGDASQTGSGETGGYVDPYLAAGGTSTDLGPGYFGSTPAPTTPSPWASIFSNLANQWSTIGGRILAPTTIITNPNGTSIQTPGALPAGTNLLSSSAGTVLGSMSTGTILIIAALGVGLMFMSKR